ncbi:rod shape-determining protein MreC, partial [Candidatus Omnitrophota bacterium]
MREISGMALYHRNMSWNRILKAEVGLLKNKLNALEELKLENARLRDLLDFKERSALKVVPSFIIGRSTDNWSSVVLINKGKRHGIKEGMTAVSHLGLAGRVIESAGGSSKVMLINDPNLGVSAIDQRSRQEGLVSGTLGNSLIMRYLPKE